MLPRQLKPIFWDVDFKQLSWTLHRDFIVERILVTFNWWSVKWLRRSMGDAAIVNWILSHKIKLTPQDISFWQAIGGLPKTYKQ